MSTRTSAAAAPASFSPATPRSWLVFGAPTTTTTTTTPREQDHDDDDDDTERHSFLLVPPPHLSRTTMKTSGGDAMMVETSSSSQFNHKKHPRSCNCSVSFDEGSIRCIYCGSGRTHRVSDPSPPRPWDSATGSDDASCHGHDVSTTSKFVVSSLSVEDELERCIKRVRLSSTPGELCVAKELRDLMTSATGWRYHGGGGGNGSADSTMDRFMDAWTTQAPSLSSSRRINRSRSTSAYANDVATTSSYRLRRSSSGWADSCGSDWYEKVLDGLPTSQEAGELQQQCCGRRGRARCRMRLGALSAHRLALHLHYSLCEGGDNTELRRPRIEANRSANVHVDVRIPRHYPHEPPVVKGIRYDDANTFSTHGMDNDNDERTSVSLRRSLSDCYPPRLALCRVDSIELVPFVTDGESGDLESSDNCNSHSQGNADGYHNAVGPSEQWDHANDEMAEAVAGSTLPNLCRKMTLHGYSPVHRLSDVLERIALALYSATPQNTTLALCDAESDVKCRTAGNSTMHSHGTLGVHGIGGAGLAKNACGPSPSPTDTSSPDASWLTSCGTNTSLRVFSSEADQATERQQ